LALVLLISSFNTVGPDTDAVCSMIAYSWIKEQVDREKWVPLLYGGINSETAFVLDDLGLMVPEAPESLPSTCRIALVDTHHPNQLHSSIMLDNVVQVFDHHPAGDPEAFPNAAICNEKVGSAATLLAEWMQKADLSPPRAVAGCLGCAIVSNTLNFAAPSTHPRDQEAFSWVSRFVTWREGFFQDMFAARSSVCGMSTSSILRSDYKRFTFGPVTVGICQFETTGLVDFLSREDLQSVLQEIKRTDQLSCVLLNAVDIIGSRSVLVVADQESRDLTSRALGTGFQGAFARFDRILLRKSDIVPMFQACFEV